MSAADNVADNEEDATLAQLRDADTDLDLFRLAGDIDDLLLDASLDEYQYVHRKGLILYSSLSVKQTIS